MSALTALPGGVFDTAADSDDEAAELRTLVDDLGSRSAQARLGRDDAPQRFDDALWRHLEDTGLARLTSTIGHGAGPTELAVVLYGLARHSAAVPLAETDLLAGWLGERTGLTLPATGPLTVAIGPAHEAGGSIVGTAVAPWARASAAVLLVASTGVATYTGLLPAGDIDIHDAYNLAGEPRERIDFALATRDLRRLDEPIAAELRRRGAWARCVQIIGAFDTAAALTVEHTRNRVQFGRSLSAFQSVQHALAGMAGQIERARAVTTLAIAAAAEHGFDSAPTDYAVTVAKAVLGRAGTEVATIAHQLHGAIGVTAENPLWLSTTRMRSWADEFGTTQHYAERIGRAVLAAADPWDLLLANPSSRINSQREMQ